MDYSLLLAVENNTMYRVSGQLEDEIKESDNSNKYLKVNEKERKTLNALTKSKAKKMKKQSKHH